MTPLQASEILQIRTLLENPFFWLGQIGLLLVALGGLVLVETLNSRPDRLPIYYTLAILGVSVGAAVTFAEPFIEPALAPLTAVGYSNRLMWGILFTVANFHYRGTNAKLLDALSIRRLNRWTIAGILVGMTLLMGMGFRLALHNNNMLKQEYIQVNRRIVTDPGVVAELKRLNKNVVQLNESNLKLSRENERINAENAAFKKQLTALNQLYAEQLKQNRILLLSLRDYVKPKK